MIASFSSRFSSAALMAGALTTLASVALGGDTSKPAVSSNPPDPNIRTYRRPLVPEDLAIFKVKAAVTPGAPYVVDVATASGVMGGGNEPSIAIDPNNPKKVRILGFAGGWGATAPVWVSNDGGITWTFQQSITAPPGKTGGGPNDQNLDFGRSGLLFGTFLSAKNNGANNNVYSGSSIDLNVPAASQWFLVAGNAQATNLVDNFMSIDQPWLLVNQDPVSTNQDNVYVAYDDFTGGNERVSVALNSAPPNFTRDNIVGSDFGGGINPGLRLATDHLTGKVYAIWQDATGGGGGGSENINYRLNRSTDGGQTWTINGSGVGGIVVANGDSNQDNSPKFGTVNALLGGVDHAAVDPQTGDVYYVYGTRDGSGNNRLGIRRLTDNGAGVLNIGTEHFVADAPVQAALPSVAVAENGTVGVLYMTFDGFSSIPDPTTPTLTEPIFSAHLAFSTDHANTFTDNLLETFISPTVDNGDPRQRLLGDYLQLKAVNRQFYGVFPGGSAAFNVAKAKGDNLADDDDDGDGVSQFIDPIFVTAFAGGPLINVNTTDINYGTQCPGSITDKAFEVFNTGTTDLHVLSISRISGSTDFALLPNPNIPTTISPDAHVDYTIRFTPTGSPGTRTATFQITSNDPDTPTTTVVVNAVLGAPDLAFTIQQAGDFGTVCVGDIANLNLQLLNHGSCPLIITAVNLFSGSAEFDRGTVVFPQTIAPGELIDISLYYRPTTFSTLPKAASFQILSNDPSGPQSINVVAFTPPGDINVSLENGGNFGDVCIGDQKTLTVQVLNQGLCTLNITNITRSAGSAEFVAATVNLPVPLSHDAHLDLPITFTPASFGAKTATFQITSDDPDTPIFNIVVNGNVPSGAITVTPCPVDFGTSVCAEDTEGHRKTVTVCNVGTCPLNVKSIAVVGPDFALDGVPALPVRVDPGSCFSFTVLFTPTSLGDKSTTLTIMSDDPINTTITCTVTGGTPASFLSVPDRLAFPPTVIQRDGPCFSERQLQIQNLGPCQVTVTSVTITGPDADVFSLDGFSTSSVPVALLPGEDLGDGFLKVLFKPTEIVTKRFLTAQINVTSVFDPFSGETTTTVIKLAGEAVQTGMRILVTKQGTPLITVQSIQVRGTTGQASYTSRNVPLKHVDGPPGFEDILSFDFHNEYGGLSAPTQRLTGNYRITVVIRDGRKQLRRSINFNADTCTFNPTLNINF